VVAVALLLSCQADSPMGVEHATPERRFAALTLEPTDEPLDGYELVDSVVLVVTEDSVIGGERELGAVTDASGPLVIEIEGQVSFQGAPVPLGAILNSNGILWYEHVMPVLRAAATDAQSPHLSDSAIPAISSAQPTLAAVPPPPVGFDVTIVRGGAGFDFSIATDSSEEYGDESVIPAVVSETSNRIRLVLDAQSRGLLTMRWAFNITRQTYSPDEHPAGCLPVFGRCVAFPPDDRLFTVLAPEDSPRTSATVTVRIYRLPGTVRRMRVSRAQVLPVFSDSFDPVTQAIGAGGTRKDTVVLTIPGLLPGSEESPDVILESDPIEGSGGHVHQPTKPRRPRGTFFRMTEGHLISNGSEGRRNRTRLRLPVGSDAEVIYRTSGVGGSEWVRLRRVRAPGDTVTLDSVLVTVWLPGLEAVPASEHFFFENSENHGVYDRYLQPGIGTLLNEILGRWRVLHDSFPGRYPMEDGQRFRVDAMSLPFGGKHDWRGLWAGAHVLHREGYDVDVNERRVESDVINDVDGLSPRLRFARLCKQYTYAYSATQSFAVECFPERNDRNDPTNLAIHFHIFFVPDSPGRSFLPWRQ
jgi:hypothetical protein